MPTNYADYMVDVWAPPKRHLREPGEWLRIKGVMDWPTALMVAQLFSVWLGYARIVADDAVVLELKAGLPREES